jgi:hypothetical protein
MLLLMSFTRTVAVLGAAIFGGVLAACVSDDVRPYQDSVSAVDAGAVSTVDAAAAVADAAAACSVPIEKGVDCFGGPRCNKFQQCCVTLGGGGNLGGDCVGKGETGLGMCLADKGAPWECDRAKDCTSNSDRCCIPKLFDFKPSAPGAACAFQLTLRSDASPPADKKIARCVQPQCPADNLTACETNAECTAPETCVPVQLQDKILGVCRTL